MVLTIRGQVQKTHRMNNFENGSSVDPSLSFDSAQTTGLFLANVDTGSMGLASNGVSALEITSNALLPAGTETYDLGSDERRFGSLYLSGNTLHLGNVVLKDEDGSLSTTAQLIGDGSGLSNLVAANINGLSDALDIIQASSVDANVANITGTVTAGSFIGDGSQLTGLSSPPGISNIQITDSSWAPIEDTALTSNVAGYLAVNGTNFAPGSIVQIDGKNSTATSYISASLLQVQTQAKASGTYTVTVIRSGDGATASLPSGVTYSEGVTWVTGSQLGSVDEAISFSIPIQASSDSQITYANIDSLPPQTSLDPVTGNLAGNITSVGSSTLYSFDVEAQDAESQTSVRNFILQLIVLLLNATQTTNSSWAPLTQTALDSNVSTAYWTIDGQGMSLVTDVLVEGTSATSFTVISDTLLRVHGPAKPRGTYDVSIVTPSLTKVFANAVVYSDVPVWVTPADLGNVDVGVAFSIPIQATSDSTVSYSNVTALPPSTTLNPASGGAVLLEGNVTDISNDTTYSFDVLATDQEIQTDVRTFLLTVLSEVFGSFVVAADDLWFIVTDKNTVISIGQNPYGANGNGDGTNGDFITDSGSLSGKTVSYISCGGNAGYTVTHLVATDGTLHATGYGANYQFGDGTIANVSIPKQISIGKTVVSVSSGYEHSCLVTSDGMLYGTGKNTYYQLGQNTTATYGSWTRINTGTLANRGIKSVACGGWSTMVIDQYDLVHVMGYGDFGNLGNYQSFPSGYWGIETVRTPYIIPKYTAGSFKVNDTARSVACGERFSVVVRTDGTVHSTGYNTYGQLGDGTYNNSNGIFVQVGGALAGKNVTEVSINNSLGTMDHAHVLTADGKVYGWGKNYFACLGIGSTGGNYPGTNYTSPVLLGGSLTGKQVVSLSSGTYTGLAITSDGLVHGWGVTFYTGERVELLVPTVIGLKPGEPPGFVEG